MNWFKQKFLVCEKSDLNKSLFKEHFIVVLYEEFPIGIRVPRENIKFAMRNRVKMANNSMNIPSHRNMQFGNKQRVRDKETQEAYDARIARFAKAMTGEADPCLNLSDELPSIYKEAKKSVDIINETMRPIQNGQLQEIKDNKNRAKNKNKKYMFSKKEILIRVSSGLFAIIIAVGTIFGTMYQSEIKKYINEKVSSIETSVSK